MIILRLAFWIFLLVASVVFISKSNLRNKKKSFTLTAVAIFVLWVVCSLFPIEGLLLRFDTPEDAYHYTHTESPPYYTVFGNRTAMVFALDNDNACSWRVFEETDDGWNIGHALDHTTCQYVLDGGITAEMIEHKRTKDTYIFLTCPYNAATTVMDNRESMLILTPNSTELQKTGYCCYYGYVGTGITDYQITVNGKVYQFYSDGVQSTTQ